MRASSSFGLRAGLAAFALLLAVPASLAQQPLKVGIVTFLSGPAAGPFGVPARNAAELTAELLNAGTVPAPYSQKGFGGTPIELVIIDEAGGPQKQVAEYRNLVPRVDIVIGYISSGDCLAIAPVAEEQKKLTVLFDCGTPRIFEDASYKYVFRTGPTGTMDNVSVALYLVERNPNVKSIAGLNQNYAWGQDSWADFENAMKTLKPGIEVKTSQMPKLFAGQFGAEITTLLGSGAEVIHSSMWGGDLEGLVLQGAPRGLFEKHKVVLSAGEPAINRLGTRIPDGTILGARGPFGPFAPDTDLARWLKTTYQDRYHIPPNYASFKMTQAILGVKAAYEKAKGSSNEAPDQDKIIAAFENLTFEGPGGPVKMALGKGHQAIMDAAVGTTKVEAGELKIVDIARYSADKVNPPDGVKSEVWIKSGLKK
ncbi:ABC transporter substrate-binding protein [Bradyrhizobium sp. WSM 1738]|uniref:ABC transporter substrate-binding protein n=1 Tax=Bradyrhizobium hereditatis TaxID=2821405 RepID=UPI001CE284F1|nr:ABC transporter substrate-binding protein [Bradyrhizobium hereditatis]MCA6116539.1 ABC transporter substrate-binding protein [Bradyrhizobium hereditatis]